MNESPLDRQIRAISRPDKALWTYYILAALAFPPAFPVLIVYLYFRYHTMRYRFSDDGISMSWGILFRREIIVNYARIQDIHLKSNVVERWLGLARILVQTASGGHGAEMTIEGIKQFEALRDFLYERMRGVKDHRPVSGAAVPAVAGDPASGSEDLATTLQAIAGELRAIRQAVEQQRGGRGGEVRRD
jgi:putative membrane protein